MSRLQRGLALGLTLTLPPLGSCATHYAQQATVAMAPPSSSSSSSSSASSAWDAEVTKATRRVEDYDWVIRQADLRATLITPRLRKVFLDERQQFHGRFADKTQQELIGLGDPDEGVDADQTLSGPKSEEQVLVFVAMYVSDQKNRDLSAGYTIWDTVLTRGNQKVKPIAVETVKASPAVAEVFPFIDRFDDLYLFRFPLVDPSTGTALLGSGPEPLRLEVKSAIAECVVGWDLEG